MLGKIVSRLGRTNVVINSFYNCISNTLKELPWTPKVSLWKISSKPRMLMQNFKCASSFKQLNGFAKFISRGSTSESHSTNNLKELNLVEEGNSSLCLRTEVSLPLM